MFTQQEEESRREANFDQALRHDGFLIMLLGDFRQLWTYKKKNRTAENYICVIRFWRYLDHINWKCTLCRSIRNIAVVDAVRSATMKTIQCLVWPFWVLFMALQPMSLSAFEPYKGTASAESVFYFILRRQREYQECTVHVLLEEK